MRTSFLFAAIWTVLSASVVHAADAQTQRMATLTAERSVVGSADYRDTVNRFLKGLEPKILGGKPALAGAFPWQVSLTVSWIADPYKAHFCGGTVYSATWIVTAAHCVEGNDPRDIVVIAGTHVLGKSGTRHNVERIISRSDFNKPLRWDNDIALLQLRDPLALGVSIRPIPLVTETEEAVLLKKGAALVVTGWGATTEGGQPVRDLQFVELPFVERDTCNRPLAYDGAISNNMLCAGNEVGGKDSCQGDSGGPLIVDSRLDPKLAGIVSWGEGCARANRVGVYTRAARYANWVSSCVTAPETCE
ncbi:serine protease [Aromatoleum toluolicum]|uniref:Trypsin-like serine protease n=1 Tax=Aromatoleum toluolicum TaxID=90060 RepID=A0ABX1NNE9_9RHOO|nr:serine protease [Aromatoleum toluolicum]NMG00885.1 serine protease [Aromatoleum toluolicum]